MDYIEIMDFGRQKKVEKMSDILEVIRESFVSVHQRNEEASGRQN